MTRIPDSHPGNPAASRLTELHREDSSPPAEQHPFDAFPPFDRASLIDSHTNDSIFPGGFEHGPAGSSLAELVTETESADIVLAEIAKLDQNKSEAHISGESFYLFSWTVSDSIADDRDVVVDFSFGRDKLRFDDLLADHDALDLPALLHDGGITVTEQDDGSLLLAHDGQQVEIHHQGSISDDQIHALTGDDAAAAAQVLRQMLLTTG